MHNFTHGGTEKFHRKAIVNILTEEPFLYTRFQEFYPICKFAFMLLIEKLDHPRHTVNFLIKSNPHHTIHLHLQLIEIADNIHYIMSPIAGVGL